MGFNSGFKGLISDTSYNNNNNVIFIIVSCHRPFLPGTSLKPTVIPTAQASSFTLQYFPYYLGCFKYITVIVIITSYLHNYLFSYLPTYLLT